MLEAVPSSRSVLARGELVRLLYRLGHQGASGVLTISSRAGEVFVLRRGHIMVPEGDAAKKLLVGRLARLVALDVVTVVFESGVAAYPPGATNQISLTGWARHHLEAQLDGTLAEVLVRELGAMSQPRRLDQIWPLARTPRFRLLAFIHFLREVDALELVGVVAEKSGPHRTVDGRRRLAAATLGIDDGADLETVKRAYRRLARELHPDLQPELDASRKRVLERRFAEVTAAYEALI